MKLALVLCDLLTIWVLVTWLRQTNRSPWLALAYAWNPLVILEVAHSGHIDALGALWIAIAAWMLTTGRTMRAAIAFVIAIASKLLPIVLVPLFWKRIRIRDAAVGALVWVLLYLPFRSAGALPLGAVPNVVAFIRFNGPLFKGLLQLVSPPARRGGRGAGGASRVAAWMRFTRPADDPAAWAWPMARVARRRAGHLPVVPALFHAVPVHAGNAAAGRVDLHGAARLRRLVSLGASGTAGSCRRRSCGSSSARSWPCWRFRSLLQLAGDRRHVLLEPRVLDLIALVLVGDLP